VAPFHAPHTAGVHTRGARGGSTSASRSIRTPRAAAGAKGSGGPREQTNAEDDDEASGTDMMGDDFDKAYWTSDNTFVFCDLWIDEMMGIATKES
jgi:hypothetical protein